VTTLKRLNKLAGTLKESSRGGLPGYDAWKTSGPDEDEMEVCSYCDGEGELWAPRMDQPETCPECHGTGFVEVEKETPEEIEESDGNDIFPPVVEGPGFNKANPQRKLEDELTTSMANALRAGMLPQDVKAAVQSALGTAVKIWTIEDEKANADTLGEPKF
jgi:hypothetical protein